MDSKIEEYLSNYSDTKINSNSRLTTEDIMRAVVGAYPELLDREPFEWVDTKAMNVRQGKHSDLFRELEKAGYTKQENRGIYIQLPSRLKKSIHNLAGGNRNKKERKSPEEMLRYNQNILLHFGINEIIKREKTKTYEIHKGNKLFDFLVKTNEKTGKEPTKIRISLYPTVLDLLRQHDVCKIKAYKESISNKEQVTLEKALISLFPERSLIGSEIGYSSKNRKQIWISKNTTSEAQLEIVEEWYEEGRKGIYCNKNRESYSLFVSSELHKSWYAYIAPEEADLQAHIDEINKHRDATEHALIDQTLALHKIALLGGDMATTAKKIMKALSDSGALTDGKISIQKQLKLAGSLTGGVIPINYKKYLIGEYMNILLNTGYVLTASEEAHIGADIKEISNYITALQASEAPRGISLYPSQAYASYLIKTTKRCIDFSNAGSGKTAAFLTAITTSGAKQVLIQTVRAVVNQIGKNYCHQYPEIEFVCITGNSKKVYNKGASIRVLVLSWNSTLGAMPQYIKEYLPCIDGYVIDEAHLGGSALSIADAIEKGIITREEAETNPLLFSQWYHKTLELSATVAKSGGFIYGATATPYSKSSKDIKAVLNLLQISEYDFTDIQKKESNMSISLLASYLKTNGVSYDLNNTLTMKKEVYTWEGNDPVDMICSAYRAGERIIVYSNKINKLNNKFTELYTVRDAVRARLGLSEESPDIAEYTGNEKCDITDPNIKILFASHAIATGVDGLQKHYGHILCLTAYKTASAFTQLLGRIYRVGTKFPTIRIGLPSEDIMTAINNNLKKLKNLRLTEDADLLTEEELCKAVKKAESKNKTRKLVLAKELAA